MQKFALMVAVVATTMAASTHFSLAKEVKLALDDSESEDYYLSFEDVVDSVQEIFSPSHVMTFTVLAREKFCFYEEITEEEIAEAHLQQTSSIEGALFVSGGRNRDVGIEIYGPDAESIHSDKIKKEGGFSVPMTKEGTYEFCFSNTMSLGSSKKVGFCWLVGWLVVGSSYLLAS